MPQNLKRQNFPIIIQILLEPIVRMSTSQFDFDILFVLFGVGRIDLGIFCSDELVEVIIG